MPSTTQTHIVIGICIGMAFMVVMDIFQPRQITIAEPVVATVEFEHWMIDEGDL